MKIRIDLSGLPGIKIEGTLEVSGLVASVVGKKIVETFKKVQREHNLKGFVGKI